MSALPPKVKPGERIKASHINAIAEAVRNLLRMKGAGGITVTQGKGGIRIGLIAAREYILDATITAVHTPSGDNGPQDLSLVKYSARVIGQPTLAEFTQMEVRYRHVSIEVEGEPAQVGDPCEIVIRRRGPSQVSYLRVFTEKTKFYECEPPAQAATVTALMAEVAAMRAELAAIKGGAGNA